MTVPLYQLTDVWGNPTQRFTAIQMNVQDGGHLTGSLLFDLQVNGISQFSIDPSGTVLLLPNLKFQSDSSPPAPGLPVLGAALALRNGTQSQAFRVYNTYTDDSNYERAGFGWLLANNTLSIGATAAGTGTLHPVQFAGANFLIAQADVGIYRVAPGVIEINNGAPGTRNACYLQWGGQARVQSDASFSTATLANVAGLVVNVSAGRTYSFEGELSITMAAAGGIKCAIGGSCTATNIIYDGWIVDAAAAGIKGNAQATALGGTVASAQTVGTAGHVTIRGTVTVNAGGTLTVQAAQFVSSSVATVIKRGSRMLVHDIT